MHHAIVINRGYSVSGIIFTVLDVSVFHKVRIQTGFAYGSTDGEIICMHKAVKEVKAIWRYMEALSLHAGATTLHWEDNTSCIYVIKAKIVNHRV